MTILSKEDLAALRKADDIVIRYENGASTIEAKKRPKDTDEFNNPRYRTIQCGAVCTVYSRKEGYKPRMVKGFEYINSARHDEKWQTIAKLLKVGDDISLHWKADCWSNDLTRRANLHGDVLFLIVRRKDGKEKLTFHVATSICEDNSARMCQISYLSLCV